MNEENNQVNKKSRLSVKGLDKIFGSMDELISDIETLTPHSATDISLSLIRSNPYQPRKIFDENEIMQLGQSILKNGVIQPVILKKAINGYELIAGERRTRAARLVGLTTIPAIIAEFSDQKMMEVALIENIQRVDLNVVEEAKAYRDLITNWKVTQEYISEQVGKSRSHITNTMRLLSLPTKIQDYILAGKLTMGQVKPLLSLRDNVALVIQLSERIIKDSLTARKVEELVHSFLPKENNKLKSKVSSQKPISTYSYVQETFISKLGTKVNIENNKITINFSDDQDLNRILHILGII